MYKNALRDVRTHVDEQVNIINNQLKENVCRQCKAQ